MAWPAYYSLDGSEIINGPRTEAYARACWCLLVPAATSRTTTSPRCSVDGPYRSPLQDDAPWADVDHPESHDFSGVYPLDIDRDRGLHPHRYRDGVDPRRWHRRPGPARYPDRRVQRHPGRAHRAKPSSTGCSG